jgi:c-di-GMP-binding flagellar brake protein YcgR
MLKKLINKAGIKTHIKRQFARGSVGVKLCATLVNNYKPGSKSYTYGDCFSIRTYDVGGGGMCISHPDRLLAGKVIMLNSKNNLKKVNCINCAMVGIVHSDFLNQLIIAKVIWATENRCGIKFLEVSEGDRRKLDKLAKTSFGDSKPTENK